MLIKEIRENNSESILIDIQIVIMAAQMEEETDESLIALTTHFAQVSSHLFFLFPPSS